MNKTQQSFNKYYKDFSFVEKGSLNSRQEHLLKENFISYLQKGNLKEYIHAISEEGLIWWFNMDTPSIIVHLALLDSFVKTDTDIPLRIRFLKDASQYTIPTHKMEKYYQEFIQAGDIEAAAAATGAAVASIWDSGAEFDRYAPWYKRISSLLERDLSPFARASLYGFKAIIETTGKGDLKKAITSSRKLLYWAERARSNSLRTFYATSICYSLIWQGRLSDAELIISDTLPLCDLPDTTFICNIYFRLTQGFFYAVKGDLNKAREILDKIQKIPFFEGLPPPAFYLTYGHLLYVLSCEGTEEEIDTIAKKIRLRAIPEQNYFHHTYIHYSLGIAYLGIGMTRKAFVHSKEALRRSRLSKSPIAQYLTALLYGQVLSNIGREQEALEYLKEWIGRWEDTGFNLLASSGALEVARIFIQRGEVVKARQYYERAVRLMPEGEELVALNRDKDFSVNIKNTIYPPNETLEIITDYKNKPVFIITFGDLQIRIGDCLIYDHAWKGEKTKALLKALIVFGGDKVSYDFLIDTLWPDSTGDAGETNLKVTLSRLRNFVCKKGGQPLQWIFVNQRKVSLARPFCAVDSLVFKETIDRISLTKDDISLLMEVLDLYRDDFLVKDHREIWIIRHREVLREDFIRGAILLSEMCKKEGNIKDSLPYLYKALEKDPLNEEVYATLMQIYIDSGYPSKAIQTYKQAEEMLKKELDISPGPKLQQLARLAGLSI